MARFVNFKLAGQGPVAINVDQVIYVRPMSQSGNTKIVFAVGIEGAAHSIIVEAPMKDVVAALENAA